MSSVIEYIKDNNVTGILDVGANVGIFSSVIRNYYPNMNLFMIEANPFCDAMLKRTGIPYKIACLSDSVKEVQFYLEDTNMVGTGASYYLENTNYYSMKNFTRMTTELLDDVVEENCKGLSFDMLKLDTQGSEIDILNGAPNTLQSIKHILIETSLIEYNIGSPLKEQVFSYLTSIGYDPVVKVEDHYFDGKLIQEDWIFTRTA